MPTRRCAMTRTGCVGPANHNVLPFPQFDLPPFVNDTYSPCWWWQTPIDNSSLTVSVHARGQIANPTSLGNVQVCNTWQPAIQHISNWFSAVCFITAVRLNEVWMLTTSLGMANLL